MVRTAGLTHIHLVVRDLERSLRFYQGVFGLREQFRAAPRMVFLNTPGSQDLITLNEDPAEAELAGVSGGVAHSASGSPVPTTSTVRSQRSKRLGASCSACGEHARGEPFAYIADPDGYVIEL
jgi:catechol 2,3-dioxygenase-like lactoylglutathione lyase family enzyme